MRIAPPAVNHRSIAASFHNYFVTDGGPPLLSLVWWWLPFPQTDSIGAMMIVWLVWGKIIGFVLCSIVCNNCAQCSAHMYEQT